MKAISPRNLCRAQFVGSSFRDAQLEMLLCCIAITQYKMNPDEWTPFTWDEYVAKCDHKPIETERQLFDAMVGGGKVLLNDAGKPKWVQLEGGHLAKNGDSYSVTDKLLKVMAPFVSE